MVESDDINPDLSSRLRQKLENLAEVQSIRSDTYVEGRLRLAANAAFECPKHLLRKATSALAQPGLAAEVYILTPTGPSAQIDGEDVKFGLD